MTSLFSFEDPGWDPVLQNPHESVNENESAHQATHQGSVTSAIIPLMSSLMGGSGAVAIGGIGGVLSPVSSLGGSHVVRDLPSGPISSLEPTGGLNLLWAEWISFSISVSLFGALILHRSVFVPAPLRRLFIYGKAMNEDEDKSDGSWPTPWKSLRERLERIEIPKRWFYHFYLFAVTFYSILAWSMVQVYVMGHGVTHSVALLLDNVVGTYRRSTVRPESVMIAMTLIWFQVVRRLLECTLLSIYSDAKMNLIHYIFGFSFYFGVGLSVLAEAPGYTSGAARGLVSEKVIPFTGSFLTWYHVAGISLFCVFSYVQFKAHAQLAALRKDHSGRVVTLGHSIPRGDLFEFVSSPHYLAEIMIYLALNLVLAGRSTTWWMVCAFVVSNQIIVGLFNHRWYQETFGKAYPAHRRAVIPFLI